MFYSCKQKTGKVSKNKKYTYKAINVSLTEPFRSVQTMAKINCGPAPNMRHAEMTSNITTATYKCLDSPTGGSFVFRNGDATVEIGCLSSGDWEDFPQQCMGRD